MTKPPKNKSAVHLGKKGGEARAAKLSPAQRSEIATKAGNANAARLARLKAEKKGLDES